MFKRFEDMDAWKAARSLTRSVYELTQEGPLARDFALRDRLRRSAISAMAAVAEGASRPSQREFQRSCSLALGSLAAVRSHLYAAADSGQLPEEASSRLTDEAQAATKLVAGLARYLRKSARKGDDSPDSDADGAALESLHEAIA